MNTNNPIITHKADLPNLAQALRNISKACKMLGVSLDIFYRYKGLAEEGSIDALVNKSRRLSKIKNRVDMATEQAVKSYLSIQPMARAMSLESKAYLFRVVAHTSFSFAIIWLTSSYT